MCDVKEYKTDFYPKGIWGLCLFDMLIYSEPLGIGDNICTNELHPCEMAKVVKTYYYYLN